MTCVLLALQTAVPSLPVIHAPEGTVVTLLSPAVLTGITSAIVAIIGALAAGIVKVLQEVKATKGLVKNSAQVGATVGEARDRKLDRIEVLVNGRYSEVLHELAVLRQAIADMTKHPGDQVLADAALRRAEDQARRVESLTEIAATHEPVPVESRD